MRPNKRRAFLKNAGALSVGAVGLNQSSVVSAGTGDDVAMVLTSDEFEKFELGEIIDELSVMSTRSDGSDVTVLWDAPAVKSEIMNRGEWDNQRSVAANVRNSRVMERVRSKHLNALEQGRERLRQSRTESTGDAGTTSHDEVTLGTDVTVTSNESGSAGSGGFGVKESKGELLLEYDQHHTEAFTYPPGGSANAWAWSGNEFSVNGSGSQFATIIADVGYAGHTFAAAAGTLSFKIEFRVKNLTDNTTAGQATVKSVNAAVAHSAEHVEDHDRHSVPVNLEAGKRYRPEIDVTANSTAYVEGGATVDFGKYLDLGYQAVDSKWFEIHF